MTDLPLDIRPEGLRVVVTWKPVDDAIGYVFTVNGRRVSHTFDGERYRVSYANVPDAVYGVQAILAGPRGSASLGSIRMPACGGSPGFGIVKAASDGDMARVRFELGEWLSVLGVGAHVRIDCHPSFVTATHTLMREMRFLGLRAMLVLYGTSSPQTEVSSRLFAVEMAEAFPDVNLWEYANEPDLDHPHGKRWTPTQYADGARGFLDGIHEANPYALRILGASWKWLDTPGNRTSDWWRLVVERWRTTGGVPDFEACSLHLYDQVRGWDDDRNIRRQAFEVTGNVRSLLDAAGLANVPIIATEVGHTAAVGEQRQDEILRDQLSDERVASNWVYAMMADTNYGLLREDRSRKPAWRTLQEAARG